MTSKWIAAAVLLSTLTGTAVTSTASAAERWRYEVDKRQAKQHDLIREGRRDGRITWRESYLLRREQMRIARMERAFRADGRLSWSERQALRHAQDAATAHIFHERNDAQSRRHYWR